MTAFADAMIFLVVMMMAITVTISVHHPQIHPDIGPDEFLMDMSNIEVRLSDLTDIGDDSLVFLSDLMALSLVQDTLVEDYLKMLLDSAFGDNRYRLVMEYGGLDKVIGSDYEYYTVQDSRTIPVSTGGSIYITLSIL